MKKGLIIFGTGKIAEVISYYATEECGYNIIAYTCDREYLNETNFLGKPVVAFEDLERHYPSIDFDLFIALGYQDMNQLRERKYQEAKLKGYNLVSIVSAKANLPKNVTYGPNCFIMSPAIIHPCVRLGANVFVWSGAMIGHHADVGDNVWVTSSANLGGNVRVGKNSLLSMNTTIGQNVAIGSLCLLGATTLVTKNLIDSSVVIRSSDKPIKLDSVRFLKISGLGIE